MIKPFHLIYFLMLFLSFFGIELKAQIITGKISGTQKESIPYATIFVTETSEGTISNSEGKYRLQLPHGKYHLTIRSMGYIQQSKEINLKSDSLILNIILQKQTFEIQEIKVFPGKEDPAWYIMRKAIAKAPYYRQKIKHYEADLYIKSNFTFTNIPKIYQNKIEIDGRKLKELIKEDVTYVIESQNQITFDYPNRYDQKVISKRTSLKGIDEPPVMQLMSSSFYEDRPNQIISPLSSMALKHYYFKYEGHIKSGEKDVFKIRVIPKRSSDELMDGYIYIIDDLWCIFSLDLKGRFEVVEYRIKQQFEDLGNLNWLPVSTGIDGNLSMLGLKGTFFYGVAMKYKKVTENDFGSKIEQKPEAQNIPKPQSQNSKEIELRKELSAIEQKKEPTNNDVRKAARLNRKILKEQYSDTILNNVYYTNYNVKDTKKDSLANNLQYWDSVRAIPLSPAEIRSYENAGELATMKSTGVDSAKVKKQEKPRSLSKKILFGDRDLAKDSILRLSYEGLLSFKNFDFNSVDGYKYKQHFELSFNTDSGKYVNIVPEIGYAFNRQAVFGSISTSLHNLLWNANSFSIGFGKESRDFKTNPPGIQPILNAASTWLFAENYMRLYETAFAKLNLTQGFGKGFNFSGSIEFNHFKPLENNVDYLFSDNKDFNPNIPGGFTIDSPELEEQKSFEYSAGFSYFKRQRKPWLQNSPYIFMRDFYQVGMIYRQGIRNVFSSISEFSRIDFGYRQQANISPSAGIDIRFNTGYFFNNRQMHYSQFKHFKSMEIPVQLEFFTHTFQLVNDYAISTNKSYLNIGGEFRSEYLLLRYLSFINKQTWSESLHLNYLLTPSVKNYWEAGYSLNSLFFLGNVGIFAGFTGFKFESAMIKLTISTD